jgi:hypothetical protein
MKREDYVFSVNIQASNANEILLVLLSQLYDEYNIYLRPLTSVQTELQRETRTAITSSKEFCQIQS